MAFPRLEKCELCDQNDPLLRSHIVPAFAFRNVMPDAGRFYNALHPKKLEQGGDRVHLLCQRCELLLSVHERKFQQLVFPAGDIGCLPLTYDSSLNLFCCSLSWRVLTYLKLSEPPKYIEQTKIAQMLHAQIAAEHHQRCEDVRSNWASSVLTSLAVDRDQHILFLNGKNLQFERSDLIGFCIFQDSDNLAVVTLIGPIVLLGFIQQGPGWINTLVDPAGSTFTASKQSAPPSFGHWLKDLYFNLEQVAR